MGVAAPSSGPGLFFGEWFLRPWAVSDYDNLGPPMELEDSMELEGIVYYTVLNEIAPVWESRGSKTIVFPKVLTHFEMHLWGETGGCITSGETGLASRFSTRCDV